MKTNTATNYEDPVLERVRVIVGKPEHPGNVLVPVTIYDLDNRRLKYQHASRDQLAAMNGDTMGEWSAYWSPRSERWNLAEYLGDLRSREAAQ